MASMLSVLVVYEWWKVSFQVTEPLVTERARRLRRDRVLRAIRAGGTKLENQKVIPIH